MITAEIRKGQLSVRWGYSRNLHRETTIRHLARSFKKAFKSLIDCCETDDTTLFTPSDFPDANLSQLELDEFISSIAPSVKSHLQTNFPDKRNTVSQQNEKSGGLRTFLSSRAVSLFRCSGRG